MILVPKLKYERLLKKIELSESTKDTSLPENDQTSKQTTEEDLTQADNDLMDKTNLLQTGLGFVTTKRKVGKPPGTSNVRQKKKKNVPWLTY